MKKILFSALTTISVAFTSAQEFEVTPDGLKEKTSGKDFAVIEVQGKTASELYNNAVKYINVSYKNPKEVIKGDVKDDFIKWETFVPNIGTIKNSFVTVPADALITVQLSFKDGKAKYEVVKRSSRWLERKRKRRRLPCAIFAAMRMRQSKNLRKIRKSMRMNPNVDRSLYKNS